MKNNIKMLFFQALLVTFGIVLINGIIALISDINGVEMIFGWETLIGAVVTGVFTAIPSLLFLIKKGPFILKVIFHFVLLFGIVMLASYIFVWSETAKDIFKIMGVFVIIYIMVWVVTFLMYKTEEVQINNALNQNRDED